ncbi:MAG: hypothetical protein J5986_09025 [Roseburia sp.]|nr:hypothetical protein [Roseburia sp.]
MKKKGLILTAAGICLAAAAVTVSLLAGRETGSAETVSVGENQRIVYGYLTSVLGNEISYTEIETSVAEAMLEKQAEKSDEKTTSDGKEAASGTGDGSMPEGAPQDGGNGTSGEQPPDMETGDLAGKAPQGMENGTLGEQPYDTEGGDSAEKTSQSIESGTSGEQLSDTETGNTADGEQSRPETGMQSGIGSGESVTALIPVGTVVHTTTDTETTFSRLAAGDFVKFLLETTEDGGETIVEIWMIQ